MPPIPTPPRTKISFAASADLGEIRHAAEEGGDPEHWESRVRGPLRLTVTGLMEAIDRRQQGMDVQQEEIRERIGRMLEEIDKRDKNGEEAWDDGDA